ncbi:MAG: glycosyltransferase, partial [Acidimicrobiia bacterium]
NGPVQDGFTRSGIPVLCLGDRQEWSPRVAVAVGQLARVLRGLRPSLIHLHGVRPIAVGSVAARLTGLGPVVSTLHGSHSLMAIGADGRRRRGLSIMAKLLHFVGFTLSDRILVDCKALEREVAQVYHGLCIDFDRIRARKVRLAYNSVDVDALDASDIRWDLRSRLNIEAGAVVYGTVSRLDEPKKGLAVLLEAFSKLTSESRPSHLIVAGDGFARRLLDKKAESLGISARVSFLGFFEHLPDVYRALDVFVLPSLSEGFPTVILEAMAFSLPVVATDVGGCNEAVNSDDNGYLVPAGDPVPLAEAMRALLRDGAQRKTMGARGRARAKSTFSVAQMSACVFRDYEEISNDFHHPPRRPSNM